MRRHLRLIISGKVQGVNYRKFIYNYIQESNLRLNEEKIITGYIKNLKNKNVELVLESSEDILNHMMLVAYAGPINAKVDMIKEYWDEKYEDYKSFNIIYE